MASPLKLVLLGGSAAKAKELVEALAARFGDAPVESGQVAGCLVYRFSGSSDLEESQGQRFQLFAASGQADFRGLYNSLLANADGAIGLIPADLTRVGESRRVLGPLHQCLQERRETASNLPFVLQYHWPRSTSVPSPEELDQALGVNPQAVQRVFTQAGTSEQSKGVENLLATLSTSNAR